MKLTQLTGDDVADANAFADAVMSMIRDDQQRGRLPKRLRSLYEVHEHVDGNEYMIEALSGFYERGDENADHMFGDAETEMSNRVSELVARRIEAEYADLGDTLDGYAMPPADGFTRMSLRDCESRFTADHARMRPAIGCDNDGHTFDECELFALARIRGMCHTLYVVPVDDFRRFAVIDWTSEGPAGALSADVRDDFESYASALRFASALAADEDDTEH